MNLYLQNLNSAEYVIGLSPKTTWNTAGYISVQLNTVVKRCALVVLKFVEIVRKIGVPSVLTTHIATCVIESPAKIV